MPPAEIHERLSLHLGVNQPDPAHYGEVRALDGAENDAYQWAEFAHGHGYQEEWRPGPQATAQAVYDWIDDAAKRNPDAVLVTWAGHGTQVASTGPAAADPEFKGLDQTWVLYDRMLIDDEIRWLVARFAPPTKVVVVSDSCHSGSVFAVERIQPRSLPAGLASRAMSTTLAQRVFDSHLELYTACLAAIGPASTPSASVVGLPACLDSERAYERGGRGCFSQAALELLESGFAGSYEELADAVRQHLYQQNPRAFWYGYDDSPVLAPAFP